MTAKRKPRETFKVGDRVYVNSRVNSPTVYELTELSPGSFNCKIAEVASDGKLYRAQEWDVSMLEMAPAHHQKPPR